LLSWVDRGCSVGTEGTRRDDGGFVDAFYATIVEYAALIPVVEILIAAGCPLLLSAFASLAVEYYRLKQRFDQTEADLLERTVGTNSRNWTNTARSLEVKAK